jgi:hypothetical protein
MGNVDGRGARRKEKGATRVVVEESRTRMLDVRVREILYLAIDRNLFYFILNTAR